MPFASATSHKLGVQGLSLVFLELLNECVFHFSQEAAVELVPLSCLQVALLQDSGLSKNVDLAPDVEIPAVDDLPMVFLFAGVGLLDVVLGVLNNDLVRLAIEFVDNSYLISLSVLDPPGFKPQLLDIVFLHQTVV